MNEKTTTESKQVEHTPGPWHLRGDTVLVKPSLQICQMDRGNKHPLTSSANAAFIVRACNCHDELVEALKASVAIIQAGPMISEIDAEQVKAFKNVVAKAEGR